MPTKRVPKSRHSTALNRAQLAFLYDEDLPDDAGPLEFTEHCALMGREDMPLIGRPTARELVEQHGDEALREWRRARRPGRPRWASRFPDLA